MYGISLSRFLPVMPVAIVAIACSGCGRGPSASATGTVTLNGATLKHRAVLTFVGEDHVPRSTQTDESGVFHIEDLSAGGTVVTLSSIPDGGPASRPLGAPNANPVAGTRIARPAGARPGLVPAQTSEVPAEYGDATHPLLTFTLHEGENPLDIDLARQSR